MHSIFSLPPKPYAEAEPVWHIQPKTAATLHDLPVQPQITSYPAEAPQALRIVIPLKDVNPEPNEYGVIIRSGWSDPRRYRIRSGTLCAGRGRRVRHWRATSQCLSAALQIGIFM